MIYYRYIGTKLLPNIDGLFLSKVIQKKTVPIQNGAVDVAIPELSFNGNSNPEIRVCVVARRRTDAPNKLTTRFDLLMDFDGTNFQIKRHYDYMPDGKADGITFAVTTAAGIASVTYSSSLLAGVYDAAFSNMYMDIFPQWPVGAVPYSASNQKNFETVSELLRQKAPSKTSYSDNSLSAKIKRWWKK
jgi:hypothetical protein